MLTTSNVQSMALISDHIPTPMCNLLSDMQNNIEKINIKTEPIITVQDRTPKASAIKLLIEASRLSQNDDA